MSKKRNEDVSMDLKDELIDLVEENRDLKKKIKRLEREIQQLKDGTYEEKDKYYDLRSPANTNTKALNHRKHKKTEEDADCSGPLTFTLADGSTRTIYPKNRPQ